MKKPDKYGVRLSTKNFRNVVSSAALSIDYDERLKIIEIEYATKEIYHYENVKKSEWEKFLLHAKKEKGLGVYINEFKTKYESPYYYYYRLIVVSHHNALV